MLEFFEIMSERCNLGVYNKYLDKESKLEADPNVSFKKLHGFNLLKWVKRGVGRPDGEEEKKQNPKETKKLEIKLPVELKSKAV